MIDIFLGALLSGLGALVDYVSNHTITCLVPALFIAGAISVFVKKDAILKYFGPDVKRYISYPLAATSGMILAVCSCTILPLFAGIYKKGSGIGPATAFLYSGPAINVLAIVYTASALGYNIGAARAVAAVLMSMIIGLFMAAIFRKHDIKLIKEAKNMPKMPLMDSSVKRPKWAAPSFFALLVGILIFAASPLDWTIKFPIVYALTITLGILLIYQFKKSDVSDWWTETWDLSKKIVPVLVIGAFIVGMIAHFIPPETFNDHLGNEGVTANLLASVIGAILYMPTLLEVPIIGETFGYSSTGNSLMGSGPALALLLAGPAVSLPNMIVLYKIMGLKKTGTYILLVVFLSTIAGFLYGNLII
ncbi:MAG: permease [Candidatus Thermoplasmatota archaeon]|nr:permease [Candidatus Thermoplasmatota archaeon]